MPRSYVDQFGIIFGSIAMFRSIDSYLAPYSSYMKKRLSWFAQLVNFDSFCDRKMMGISYHTLKNPGNVSSLSWHRH